MKYQGIEVDEINILLELKDRPKEEWDDNEDYVDELLEKNGIEGLIVENPIDNLVYMQPSFLDAADVSVGDIVLFTGIYTMVQNIFPSAKIALHLEKFINNINEVDVTLDEFKTLI